MGRRRWWYIRRRSGEVSTQAGTRTFRSRHIESEYPFRSLPSVRLTLYIKIATKSHWTAHTTAGQLTIPPSNLINPLTSSRLSKPSTHFSISSLLSASKTSSTTICHFLIMSSSDAMGSIPLGAFTYVSTSVPSLNLTVIVVVHPFSLPVSYASLCVGVIFSVNSRICGRWSLSAPNCAISMERSINCAAAAYCTLICAAVVVGGVSLGTAHPACLKAGLLC